MLAHRLRSTGAAIAALFALLPTTLSCRGTGAAPEPVSPLAFDPSRADLPNLASPAALRDFDRGLELWLAGEGLAARRSFERVTVLEPEHSAGWWGLALALGPRAASQPFEIDGGVESHEDPYEDPYQAFEAAQRALELSAGGDDPERTRAAALALRYEAAGSGARLAQDHAYASALQSADVDGGATARELALLADAWLVVDQRLRSDGDSGDEAPPAALLARAAIDRALALEPDHVGALRLHLILLRRSDDAEAAAKVAERVGGAWVTPTVLCEAARAFVRAGEHRRAADLAEQAAAAAAAWNEWARASGLGDIADVSAALRLAWRCAARAGQGVRAIDLARRAALALADAPSKGPSEGPSEGPERVTYLADPICALARFGRWSELLALPAPEAAHPFTAGMAHYGRCLAHTHFGELAAADRELLLLRASCKDRRLVDLQLADGASAARLLELALLVAEARLAQVRGDDALALEKLRRGVRLQDEWPSEAPSPWYLPMRQALGNALVAAGRHAEAEVSYEQALALRPRDAWSLYGLESSLRWQGLGHQAQLVHAEFRTAWEHADVDLGKFTNACAAATPAAPKR